MEVVPLDLATEGNITAIVDEELRESVPKFYKHFLRGPFDPRKLMKVWVAREGKHILAISGYTSVADIPVFRSIDEGATKLIADRMNSFFADNGMRGRDVFLFLSDREAEEQRCPNRDKYVELFGAVPSERYIVPVR